MEAITPEEARALDENADFLGISMLQLMESAGRGVVESILKRRDVKGKKIVILAYTGNKGGDGFVIARHLSSLGAHPSVILLARPEQISSDEAALNYCVVTKLRASVSIWAAPAASDLLLLKDEIDSADIVIDAMLGTGAKGQLREPLKTGVSLANSSRAYKVAVDIPTGVDASTGVTSGEAFRADLTITHHKVKVGLTEKPSTDLAGEIEVISIGIPPEAEIYCGPGDLRMALKPRGTYSHKGENGRLLVIGGSSRYAGAPSLAALAALRLGVDLVTVAVPKSIVHEVRTFSPDLIVVPLPSDEILDRSCITSLKKEMESANAVVIGMGLGLESETKSVVKELSSHIQSKGIPAVIDADALKALGELGPSLELKNTVVTPHAGEFFALTGEKLASEREDGWGERLNAIMKSAIKLKCSVLLKSRYDIITDGYRFKIKTIGNPGMTVGGTGDVLAGITGALLARGAGVYNSAVAASFLNSYTGDLLAADTGQRFTARDLIGAIPKALKELNI